MLDDKVMTKSVEIPQDGELTKVTRVLTIGTICHAQDLWKLARCCKQLYLLYLPDPWNLPGTALLSGFQSSQGALKSTESDST